jgi:hypothetical protein
VGCPAPWSYSGSFTPCGAGIADVDGDGDRDLVLQHPDGLQWFTVRNAQRCQHPVLYGTVQDLSLVPLGWYGATYTLAVPPDWDLAALPAIELQVMVEHPVTQEQRRWDRRTAAIDPLTRQASFVVQWQDFAAAWTAILDAPNPQGLLPYSFVVNGWATSGRRTELVFLGIGPGNPFHNGGERRGEALVLFTDPTGGGNKSAQGIAWEPRTAPPLPKADDAMLPWQ